MKVDEKPGEQRGLREVEEYKIAGNEREFAGNRSYAGRKTYPELAGRGASSLSP